MFDINNAIIPVPLDISGGDIDIIIGEFSKAVVSLNVVSQNPCIQSAKNKIENVLKNFGICPSDDASYKISVIVDNTDSHFNDINNDEAYVIYSTPDGAKLVGSGDAGAFYAAVSYSKMLHADGVDVCVPECTIFDKPRFATRGHFFECRWGSDMMTLNEWKRIVDELADIKINCIVMGLYGCWSRQYDGIFAEYQYIPLKSHPELNTPRSTKYYSAKDKKWHYQKNVLPPIYTDDFFGDIISYAKTKNIEIIPLFNSLGHNTLIPRVHPEISAVQEDGTLGSFGFCTNNPKTYDLMFDIYDEIIDRYLEPNGITSFAIGMDEVCGYRGVDELNLEKVTSPFCKCGKCKYADYGELMIEYIIAIAKHMKQKGIKSLYIYHDMFFEKGLLNEELAKRFKDEGVWDIIVIDWWNYSSRDKFFGGKKDEVNTCFRSTGKSISGYYYWCAPSHTTDNVAQMAALADEKNFEGLIAYSSYDDTYDFNFKVYSQYCWNPDSDWHDILHRYAKSEFPECGDEAHRILSLAAQVTNDYYESDNLTCAFFNYYFASYLRDASDYPQDYPSKRFRDMAENEEKYLGYLEKTLPVANEIYSFFAQKVSGRTADIWKLISLNYSVLCDIFYTLYKSSVKYNVSEISAEDFVREIDRLIIKTDEYMSLCEEVRIRANQYITLRNMSIERQFLCDLKEHIQSQLITNKKPQIDLCNCGSILSPMSRFLR